MMTAETSYVARPRASVWASLSEEHDKAREILEDLLAMFEQGSGARVLSIVGPYGSGKSELMAWGFRHAWKDLKLPAIYVNLEGLLDALPQSLSPKELVDEIGRFIINQLSQISTHLEEKPRPEEVHLATDVKPGESFLEYLRDLFDTSDLSPEILRTCLASGRAVLFLDEIEQKYAELTKRVSADDRAPFREVFQSIEQGLTNYYLVGSFGLTSAYESVSDADTRRQATVRLPIPKARRLKLPQDAEPYRNFIWWASRGRPGWARKLATEWGQQLIHIEEFEEIGRLEPRTIDSLPIIDVNAHPQLLSNSRASSMFTALLKTMRPVPLSALPGFQGSAEHLAELFGEHWFVVAGEDGRVAVKDFCDNLLSDLRKFADEAGIGIRNLYLLASYLRLIVQAMADEDDTLVMGAWRGDSHIVIRAVIVPLLQTLRDLLLEFEGDTEEVGELLSLIDEVFAKGKVMGDRIEAMAFLEERFDRTIDPLTQVRRPRDIREVALSPLAIDNLFPRMVGRPLLLVSRQARGSIREQAAAVESDVAARGLFLNTTLYHDNITVRVFFVPGKPALERLQERILGRNDRSAYLAADSVYVIVPLTDDLRISDLNRERNSDDLSVLRQIEKVQLHQLDERRTQDFLISLWDNLRLMGQITGNADLQIQLDQLHDNPQLSKSQRRQVDYFRTRLRQRFSQLCSLATNAYRAARRELFDAQDERLLNRLGGILNAVKVARTVELVAVAFDVSRDRERSLEILFELRQLERLIDLLANPHGYKEFLNGAAVRSRSNDVRPGALLNEVVEYVQANDGFADLLDLASKLGLMLGDDWAQMTEHTEDAPILKLFGRIDDARTAFLRGISFQAFLAQKHDVLNEYIAAQAQACLQLERMLEQLIQQILQFNQQIQRPLLDPRRIEHYKNEVIKLRTLLNTDHSIPPAVHYVLYRFAQAAVIQLDEQRQRWKGEKGLDGWQTTFRPILDGLIQLKKLAGNIERLYDQNRELKDLLLGNPERVVSELQQPVIRAISMLFGSLDKTYELESKVPILDVDQLTRAFTEVEHELERIASNAHNIDQLALQLSKMHERMGQVLEHMQVTS